MSSPTSAGFGGATTCLELDLPTARLIIDAGSGILDLGRARGVDRKPTLMLFSHLHWDHVVGLPFYSPLYVPGWDLDVRGVPRSGRSVYDTVTELNRPPLFPISLRESVRASVTQTDLETDGELLFHGAKVEWLEVAHPGGCSAFAITVDGRRIVFSGDVELDKTNRAAFIAFCKDAELLICDAQYSAAEYPNHVGWGHSTNRQAAQLAADAGVSRLVLTHHDPGHDDAAVRAMVADAATCFASVEGARDGLVVASSRR
ncbi:MAG: MBL fold metallo-hydrolase [Myxococcales bacterium]|nr:MBL fold metallo-hydrolase [Myxococcales bacterium]MCB9531928.1 MBL fold metallo-hydrolase [Myxococcales bacterium]